MTKVAVGEQIKPGGTSVVEASCTVSLQGRYILVTGVSIYDETIFFTP